MTNQETMKMLVEAEGECGVMEMLAQVIEVRGLELSVKYKNPEIAGTSHAMAYALNCLAKGMRHS